MCINVRQIWLGITWVLSVTSAVVLVIIRAFQESDELILKLCFLPSVALTLIGLLVTYAKIHVTLKKIGIDVQRKSIHPPEGIYLATKRNRVET